jgi:flagella basal body P-ring formation protein FlgA
MIRKLILTAAIYITASTAAFSANGLDSATAMLTTAIAEKVALSDPNNEIRPEIFKGKEYLAAVDSANIKLLNLDCDKDRGFFKAMVMVDDNITLEANGRFSEITQVPVPARKLSREDVITASDIIFAEIDARKLKRGYITDEAELIGKSPVRGVLEGRPVLPNQISMPIMVKKQQALTISYHNNVLHIESSGQALDDGAAGEMIRVKNLGSNKIIYAKIIDDGTVEVQPLTSVASN